MRLLILAALALASSACATTSPNAQLRSKADVNRERQEDRVRNMQDEFNTLFPDG